MRRKRGPEDAIIDAAMRMTMERNPPEYVHFIDLDGNYRVAHKGDPDACEALRRRLALSTPGSEGGR